VLRDARFSGRHQEPPDVAWPEPELDVGVDAGLLRPLLELELLELFELLELLELEPDVPDVPDVPELLEPEPVLPVLVPELLDVELVDEALLVVPGSTSATAPAASTLAAPTAAVVVLIRPRPRRRAATARDTVSRCGLSMT
jgi:hypothetical protein